MGLSNRVKAAVAAGAVVAVAATGTVLAAGGTITVCVHKHGGILYRAGHCASGDGKLAWNLKGPPGAAGPAGPAGPTGPTGPQGLQGMQGPSAAFSAFHDASVPVNSTSLTQIGVLNVPAGDYVAFAKTWANNITSASAVVRCELAGGGDSDDIRLSLAQVGAAGQAETISTNVVHAFTSPGTFTLSCANNGGTTVDYNNIKLTAIQVGSLTNTGF